jgi:chloramphenicol 3-O-phosphotransferase
MEPGRLAGLRTFSSVAADILASPPRRGGTRIVAVDGGSAAGKSTFAARLARALGTTVVHTDDVAWWESFFGWTPLLVEGVLEPLLEGRSVRFRPPAWQARERDGAIVAEPGPALVVEGVGAGRQELSDYLDHLIWVDTDRQLAYERGLARPGEDAGFWREWELEEEGHFSRDRPWERADLLVSNDPPLPPDPERQLRVIDAATWRIEDRPR